MNRVNDRPQRTHTPMVSPRECPSVFSAQCKTGICFLAFRRGRVYHRLSQPGPAEDGRETEGNRLQGQVKKKQVPRYHPKRRGVFSGTPMTRSSG